MTLNRYVLILLKNRRLLIKKMHEGPTPPLMVSQKEKTVHVFKIISNIAGIFQRIV